MKNNEHWWATDYYKYKGSPNCLKQRFISFDFNKSHYFER